MFFEFCLGPGKLHEKVESSGRCPVCGEHAARLWQDSRLTRADWSPTAVRLLWEAVVSTVRAYGTGWSALRVADSNIPAAALPPKLQLESIPKDQVEELPGGVYRWGRYKTEPGLSDKEEGWRILDLQWQEDRPIRINLLREVDAQQPKRPQNQPGEKVRLRQDGQAKVYEGRLWPIEENQWQFEEDGTGLRVVVEMPAAAMTRQYFLRREAKLYRAMRAEHVKGKLEANKKARKEATQADIPKGVGDMAVKGRTKEGELIYTWGTEDRGRVEVEVTPRSRRTSLQEDESSFKQAAARESTPERALRKMKSKVQRMHARAAKGRHERIVAKAAPGPDEALAPSVAPEMEVFSPALRSLNDPVALSCVRVMYEFLATLRLHYCSNCDEEWPVFDGEWPQSGVAWTGPKAGRCETIERAGFQASRKKPWLCSRCEASASAYSVTYCEENLQHLGPRRPALSATTWYESLLMARVHPVMSVITLTATGLLVYAGHVCNYYVKVMDWVRGLPAVLRDKKWFLIKRRRSIRASAAETRQKKPTTANRRRLEAAIREARMYMPNVYADSVDLPEELAKFPVEGEQEMLEQEESVDLAGDVKLSREVFVSWVGSAAASAPPCPCAAIIGRYAMDHQGVDIRGGVTGETAWELCARLLSMQSDHCKLGTREIAQLVVYWLEEGHVPSQMGEALYHGMVADLRERDKRVESAEDEQLMKCRWVRQIIHGELDSVRERLGGRGEELPIDLEVEGELLQGEQLPANAEAELEATALLQDLRQQQSSSIGTAVRPEAVDIWDDFDDWWHDDDPDAWGVDHTLDAEYGGTERANACISSAAGAGAWEESCGENPLASGHAVAGANLQQNVAQVGQKPTDGQSDATIAGAKQHDVAQIRGMPLVEPPEFGDRVKDTDKEDLFFPSLPSGCVLVFN